MKKTEANPDFVLDRELIQNYKNKIQVWQDAEERSKEYLKLAQEKRKAAERILANYLRTGRTKVRLHQ